MMMVRVSRLAGKIPTLLRWVGTMETKEVSLGLEEEDLQDRGWVMEDRGWGLEVTDLDLVIWGSEVLMVQGGATE